MTKDSRVYLVHILECIQKIERFTVEGEGRFFEEEMVHDAVIRNLEIIGEAAKRIDEAYRLAHPEIPWRALASLRDVLIHQYKRGNEQGDVRRAVHGVGMAGREYLSRLEVCGL
jgi:uncharacterized protein with HEPN domain